MGPLGNGIVLNSSGMGNFIKAFVKYLSIGLALLGISGGLVYWLTLPAGRKVSRKSGSNVSRPAQAPEFFVPLYSDDWLDDSGYGIAVQDTLPVTDPNSLAEIQTSARGRTDRAITRVKKELDALDLRKPQDKAQAIQKMVFLGILHMNEGQFAQADAWYAQAQAVDPNCPRLLRANIEALRAVAALRQGEADNCVACCNEASCIFPLASQAVHQFPTGSRMAIERFTSYLDQRPDDLGVQWLLNVAHMTLGQYPDQVPKPYRIPLEPFRSGANIGKFPNVAAATKLAARGENMAGGVVVDDFDGDNRLDVFYSTIDTEQGCALFINRGNGTFEKRTTQAGLDDQVGAENCVHADFDNDGDLDVFLIRGTWEVARRPSLLLNDGNGRFEDVTMKAGLARPISSETAAWADYDRDGHLDLYLGGEYDPKSPKAINKGRLYHNNGNGTFTDVAEQAGVLNERFCRGMSWGDFDNDGDPDLYLSNQGQPNRLYRNNGDGTFTDVAKEQGVDQPIESYACWFWDYDNDGMLDLYVTGSSASLSQVIKSHLGRPAVGERPRLFHNEGGRFCDVAKESGLDRVWLPMGSNYGDIDNDGFLDFYLGTGSPPYSSLMPNILMHNRGGQRFDDITTSSGTGHLQKGHGIAFADWDADGDIDLFLEAGGAVPGDKAHNALFENPGQGNYFIRLKLVGTKSNRSGVGSKVRIDVTGPEGKRSIHRLIGPGGSFGNNPLSPTIGLGKAEVIDAIEVQWPSGGKQTVHGLKPNIAIEITEGTEGFKPLVLGQTGIVRMD